MTIIAIILLLMGLPLQYSIPMFHFTNSRQLSAYFRNSWESTIVSHDKLSILYWCMFSNSQIMTYFIKTTAVDGLQNNDLKYTNSSVQN